MIPLRTDDEITLRDAQAGDGPFLLALYAETRAAEFASSGWPAAMADAFMTMQFEAQRSDYQRRHPASRCQVIEANGRPAGRLWLAQDARGISVLDITLRQAMRGRGIASECLRRVQRQAAAAELEVRLQVVNGNPAQRLYERLGFRSVGRGDVRQAMAWQTATAAAPP